MNKNDRRVKKTKKAIQNAFAELMLEKRIQDITVQELVDKADIHRATFYSHYHDIYDLYEQIESDMICEFSSIMRNDPTHSYEKLFETLIDYICNNSMLCKMLLNKKGNRSFQSHVFSLLEEKYIQIYIFEEKQAVITEDIRYLINYHIQGCIAILSHWLENGLTYPKEKMKQLMINVDNNMDVLFVKQTQNC